MTAQVLHSVLRLQSWQTCIQQTIIVRMTLCCGLIWQTHPSIRASLRAAKADEVCTTT